MTKQMLDTEAQMTLAAAIEAEAQAQAICMAHPDFRAAYDANKAKQPARFEGAPTFADEPAGGPFAPGREPRPAKTGKPTGSAS